MKALLLSIILGAIFISLYVELGKLVNNKKEEHVTQIHLSKCDSVHLANDSLVQRMEVLDRRLKQYQIGLWFLRDKDKKAYDYVINAGNLDFKNEW